MYGQTLNTKQFTAKKVHRDNGYEYIREAYLSYTSFDGKEHPSGSYLPQECFKQVKEAYLMPNGHLILPGDKYIRQIGIWEDGFGMFKTKKVYWDIIDSLNLYPED